MELDTGDLPDARAPEVGVRLQTASKKVSEATALLYHNPDPAHPMSPQSIEQPGHIPNPPRAFSHPTNSFMTACYAAAEDALITPSYPDAVAAVRVQIVQLEVLLS